MIASLASPLALGQTAVSGDISSSTTWTKANSPYLVTADVTVNNSATLTIEAGTTVRFQSSTRLRILSGALRAIGTSSERIVFTSAKDAAGATTPAAPGDWNGIAFESGTISAVSRIDYADVRFGNGIKLVSASPTISNTNLANHIGAAIEIDLTSSPIGRGLSASGNQLNGIRVPAGDILGSVTWGLVGIPYVIEEGIVSIGRAPISLDPKSVTVTPGVQVTYTVSVASPAPSGGLVVDLASSVPSVATVPATATIAAGASSATFTLNAVAIGNTTLTASRPGLGDATSSVRVVALPTLQATPASVVLGLNKTQTFTVQLSSPAPTGGLTLNLSNSNTAAVMVPATVNVPAGASSASFSVTTAAAGNASLGIQAQGYSSTNIQITVRPIALSVSANSIVAPGATVGVPILLTEPAPAGGLTISLTSSDPSKATVASPINVPSGGTAANVTVSGVSAGQATLTASATGYESGSGVITVDTIAVQSTPSGTQNIPAGLTQSLTVRLSKPAPAGGVEISLSSSDPSKATVSPSTVTIAAGQTSSTTIAAIAAVAPGNATINLTSPGLMTLALPVTVLQPASLRVRFIWSTTELPLGKGLLNGPGAVYVERIVNGQAFNGTDAVTVN
ncbi:MAG: hypothetical protein ACRCWJ_00120, partial [Casimicrobium sp.]